MRDYLKNKSSFKSKADWVTVLDGSQEGAYQWVCYYILPNVRLCIGGWLSVSCIPVTGDYLAAQDVRLFLYGKHILY